MKSFNINSCIIVFICFCWMISLFSCQSPSSPLHSILPKSIDSTFWLKPNDGIRGVFEDSKGNIWLTSTSFVCKFDGTSLQYFTEKDGLGCNGYVQEDQNGLIWIEGGFEGYSYDGQSFTVHPFIPDTTGSKQNLSDHDLWFQRGIRRFGNTEIPPGVYRLQNGKIGFLPFPVPEKDYMDHRYHPTTGAIKGLDNTLWFGTMEMVIGYKGGDQFEFIDREKMGRQNDPNHIGIRGICIDSKGDLWIADNGSGVFIYNGDSTINFTQLHHLDKNDREGPTLHRCFSIAEDKDGNMWFGTVYSGIWQYEPTTNQFTNFSEKEGMPSQNIWTIYKTPKGELLFAGEKPGAVYQFNGNTFDRVF